ncbi:hypothetical protein PoB_007571300 [Plakobranchus ocellatus]|uniref:Uncharacterized protein n=1 Tax=Plakobranchus ocellatus TaxID=259542 RepID=A0AAV4DYP4_9GAST|nr:hypothetical protein PoB_007571300 [Plakobranchus ocellatus]
MKPVCSHPKLKIPSCPHASFPGFRAIHCYAVISVATERSVPNFEREWQQKRSMEDGRHPPAQGAGTFVGTHLSKKRGLFEEKKSPGVLVCFVLSGSLALYGWGAFL